LASTTTAHVFAGLALAGHQAVLPLYEAIDVATPSAAVSPPSSYVPPRGGACATPTARSPAEAYRDWYGASRPEDRPPGNLI
jgi:hypothetical protein